MEYILLIIAFLLIINVTSRVKELEGRLKRLQYSVDQLTNHSEHPIDDELRELIAEGKEIKAVKKARDALGLSLIEGKEYVEKLKE